MSTAHDFLPHMVRQLSSWRLLQNSLSHVLRSLADSKSNKQSRRHFQTVVANMGDDRCQGESLTFTTLHTHTHRSRQLRCFCWSVLQNNATDPQQVPPILTTGAQFTCFTSTNVQILTHQRMQAMSSSNWQLAWGRPTERVQILRGWRKTLGVIRRCIQVLSQRRLLWRS